MQAAPNTAGDETTVPFRVFPQFNDEGRQALARVRARFAEHADELFPSEGFPDRLARTLLKARTVSLKELLESFEFVGRVRRRLRAPVMADLCCGHGLTGILFAAFERQVTRVVLLDQREPDSAARVLAAVAELAPWVNDKVERATVDVRRGSEVLDPQTALLAVHACGRRTDHCIDLALALDAPIAAMPCCYRYTVRGAPRALHRGLGAELATDVHRTYRLEAAGYEVDWSAIPAAISPKNRIIVARPLRRES